MLTEKQCERLAKLGYTHVALKKTMFADCETPVSIYRKISHARYSFLLESASAGRYWGRYSIMGVTSGHFVKIYSGCFIIGTEGGQEQKISTSNPLKELEKYLHSFRIYTEDPKSVPFHGGGVGYIGFESIRYTEPAFAGLRDRKNVLDTPDVFLLFPEKIAVFDNLKQTVALLTFITLSEGKRGYHKGVEMLEAFEQEVHVVSKYILQVPKDSYISLIDRFTSSCGRREFMRRVDVCRKHIIEGDALQIVLSHCLSADFTIEPFQLYRSLRRINPSPYMFYFDFEAFQVVGASPEILVSCTDDKLKLRPIAGTRKRGETEVEDQVLERELLSDEKERAEHLMLIDLGRNDLGRIAQSGSVCVPESFIIEHYSHVMHIASHITARKKEGLSTVDVLSATFPAGTVSGAPKVRAIQIIGELENIPRGIYAGGVGYFGWDDSLDMAISIRTAVIKEGKIYVQAGAGIVYDSDPEAEWKETLKKAGAIIRAMEDA